MNDATFNEMVSKVREADTLEEKERIADQYYVDSARSGEKGRRWIRRALFVVYASGVVVTTAAVVDFAWSLMTGGY